MHHQLINLHWWSNHTHLRDILSTGQPDSGAGEGKDYRVGGNATPRLLLSRTWLAYLACVFNPYNGRLTP
jgi:hypothetical protein